MDNNLLTKTFVKGSKYISRKKLGIVFYKERGTSPYVIVKKLLKFNPITSKTKVVWFARTLKSIKYNIQYVENEGGTAEEGVDAWFGQVVDYDMIEAIEEIL